MKNLSIICFVLLLGACSKTIDDVTIKNQSSIYYQFSQKVDDASYMGVCGSPKQVYKDLHWKILLNQKPHQWKESFNILRQATDTVLQKTEYCIAVQSLCLRYLALCQRIPKEDFEKLDKVFFQNIIYCMDLLIERKNCDWRKLADAYLQAYYYIPTKKRQKYKEYIVEEANKNKKTLSPHNFNDQNDPQYLQRLEVNQAKARQEAIIYALDIVQKLN